MIRRLLNTNPGPKYFHVVLLLLRLTALLLLLNHGLSKFNNLISGNEIKFSDPIGLGPEVSYVLVVFAEFLCSLFIIFGLGTRIASIPLIINFLVIVFVVQLPNSIARIELPVFYLIIFISLLILGGGKYSIDHLLQSKKNNQPPQN
jgi:putative oxidoreductase